MPRLQQPLGCTVLLCLLLVSTIVHTRAVTGKSGTSGSGASRTTTTTAASSSSGGRVTYGSSIGTTYRWRVITAATLAIVYFNGQSYPAARFYYDGYYDDCALRNVTAQQLGSNDSSIDQTVLLRLPDLLAASNSSADVLAFNQTLYNTTNGLIIDSTYCNYTSLNSAAGAARLSVLLAALLVAAALWVTTSGSGGGLGGAPGGRGWGEA